jgi:serine/threonine-protein kinase
MKTTAQYVGKQIKNYTVTEQLYEGGIGTVFRAEQPTIGRQVAIKVIDLALSEHPEVYELFLAEAKIIASIDHPNIVDIYDFGRTDHGHLYYVTELLKGTTLSERLEVSGRMTLQEAGPYLLQICAGLNAAHGASVIHRDLRPENVLLLDTLEPKAKITDFGVAKVLDIEPRGLAKTARGIVMGAPLTISPEQAAGLHDQLSPQSDIYSLGAILFWMLAGRPPFFEGPAAVILAKHITAPPPPLRSVVPEVTDGIAAIVHRCLEKEPQNRPTATEVATVVGTELERLGLSRISGTYRPPLSDTLPPLSEDPAEKPKKKVSTKPLVETDLPVDPPPASAPPAVPFRETEPIPQPEIPETGAETGADDAALQPRTESGPGEFQLPPDSSVHPLLWGARVVTTIGPDGKLEPQFESPPRRRLTWAMWTAVALAIVSIVVFILICVM